VASQINPRLARLWLADNIRQYGYRKPLRLESLSEPELRILDYLEAGITASQVQSLTQIARADSETVGSVLGRVSSVLTDSGRLAPELTAAEINTRFAELARLFSAEGNFADALARRQSARVFIESLGRTGLVFAKALSASEIGTLLTLDQLRVSEKDCLPLGHPRSSLGVPRATSAKAQLDNTQLQFHSRRSGSLDTVTAAVLIANHTLIRTPTKPGWRGTCLMWPFALTRKASRLARWSCLERPRALAASKRPGLRQIQIGKPLHPSFSP